MEDFDNELVMSVASLWEMAIKVSIGKLDLLENFDQFIPEKLEENEIEILHVRLAHLSEMMKLPFHHRDPFDRLIIAQSVSENLPVIARDGIFKEYPKESSVPCEACLSIGRAGFRRVCRCHQGVACVRRGTQEPGRPRKFPMGRDEESRPCR